MSPLTADAVASFDDVLVDREAPTAAGAEDDREDDAPVRARTIHRFTQGETVGVVRHRDRTSEGGFEIGFQSAAVQAGRIGVAVQTGRG